MNPQELAELAVKDLGPLLAAGTQIVPAQPGRRKKGGRYSPGNQFWVSVPGGLELSMQRSLPATVWEAAILEPYGIALSDLDGVADEVARSASDDVIVRAIARQVGGTAAATVESALRFLLRSAAATYEGQPVHLNLLLDLDLPAGGAALGSLTGFQTHDWYAVLGSGLDTGILVNSTGEVVGVADVRGQANGAPPNQLRPDALRDIGHWTSEGTRVALSLARTREIVIQQHGVLRYVFRSGRWKALPLEVTMKSSWSSGSGVGKALKQAVLASAIDASLGHHGACISVVTRGHATAFNNSGVVRAQDRWPTDVRAKLFGVVKFQDLTRRQRVELLSMDGATVMDHTGRILTAGAIVAVPGGSAGGGRLAATRALAAFGAALKVSQDGPIRLYGRDGNGEVVERMALA